MVVMNDDTIKALQSLKEVNEALIMGLEGAVHYMENWEELTPEKRQSTIDKLKALMVQSDKFYGTKPTEH